ncbi:MAG: hypothetical protein LBJ11_10220 [Oscillospiraceae bacterium]|jgi:hypothetical protein|nr:hypothetical protein [Oscillospiraceae bacterium]
MEAFIKDQVIATLKYAPVHIAASYLKKKACPEAARLRGQLGGFIKGICHPSDQYGQIRGAGIEWNRADIPVPFDRDGNLRQAYADWKERMRGYRRGGIRILAVTPYPHEFIEHGVDPRTPEGERRLKEIAVFLIRDLREIIEAVQITNEQGLPRFTLPLTMAEAVRFIGVQLKAMAPYKENILLGYNSAGPQADLHSQMRPWHQYCDWIGIDIYIGCFLEQGNFLYMYDILLRYLWSLTGKPILLCEFGYISGGAPKTAAEKRAVLERYGVSSEAELRRDVDRVMASMKAQNERMYRYIMDNASGGYADFILNNIEFTNHFYSQLPAKTVLPGCPHTPRGQAAFYRDILPKLAKLPFLLGCFIYCWQDSGMCYVCGQADCPHETRWGLLTVDGKEKPAYYAVKDAFSKIS